MIIVTRKTSQTRVVTGTITALYLLNMAQLALTWQVSQSIYMDSEETRKTIFNATFFTAVWVTIVMQIITAIANILADGLLVSTTFTMPFRFNHLKLEKIWRCYYAWGRSLFVGIVRGNPGVFQLYPYPYP
jgi:ABC-type sugar transport system permease subunit